MDERTTNIVAFIMGAEGLCLLAWMAFYYWRLKRMSPPEPEEPVHIQIGGTMFTHKLVMSAYRKLRDHHRSRDVN
jgi:hypothetical protein